jgi:hypothetical protein
VCPKAPKVSRIKGTKGNNAGHTGITIKETIASNLNISIKPTDSETRMEIFKV